MSYRVIWKYRLGFVLADQRLRMRAGSEILHVAIQDHAPCIWAHADAAPGEEEERTFRLVPTGEPIPAEWSYIGTVHIDWTVWHIHETTPR
jgi:hypothetical protein